MLIPVLILLVGLIFNSAEAAGAARDALSNCAELIIPSLFPFFVLSMLLGRLGFADRLAEVTKIRGISAFLSGIFGGYPLGAVSVADMLRRGELTRDEAEALLPCCNNTGPAFIIGAVGTGVFSSVKIGFILYLIHIISALPLAVRSGFFSPAATAGHKSEPFVSAFPAAVKDAVAAVLNVCGFVVCFTVFIRLINLAALAKILSSLSGFEASFLNVFFSGLFELGSAVAAMKGMETTAVNLALASFVLGFGGLSVHCQTAALTQDTGIDLTAHFFGRLLCASAAAVFSFAVFSILL